MQTMEITLNEQKTKKAKEKRKYNNQTLMEQTSFHPENFQHFLYSFCEKKQKNERNTLRICFLNKFAMHIK